MLAYANLQTALKGSKHSLSLGTRNAQLDNKFHFAALGSVLGSTYNITQVKNTGVGITTGLSGYIPFREGINATLFYKLRGSILWGTNKTSSEGRFGEELIPGALNRSIIGRTTIINLEHDDTESTVIGEAQIGIDIDYNLFGKPSGAFLRAMFEYQNWQTDIAAYENVGWTAPFWTIVDVDDADILSLVGFSISTGYEW